MITITITYNHKYSSSSHQPHPRPAAPRSGRDVVYDGISASDPLSTSGVTGRRAVDRPCSTLQSLPSRPPRLQTAMKDHGIGVCDLGASVPSPGACDCATRDAAVCAAGSMMTHCHAVLFPHPLPPSFSTPPSPRLPCARAATHFASLCDSLSRLRTG